MHGSRPDLLQSIRLTGASSCSVFITAHVAASYGASCRTTKDGNVVPRRWKFDSCAAFVAHQYDASIPCSQALHAFEPCAIEEPHACGYGLACIAESISTAVCAPVCGAAFHDELLHLDSAAAGCTLDGQSGTTVLDDDGESTEVGHVHVRRGLALPACVPVLRLANVSGQKLFASQNSSSTGAAQEAQLEDHDEVLVQSLPQPQASRLALAQQVVGLNLMFQEAQRAGITPPNKDIFNAVWSWKRPAFTKICPTFRKRLESTDDHDRHFDRFAGYFQAGSAVIATGPAAFAATQQAIGATYFLGTLGNSTVTAAIADPDQCITKSLQQHELKRLVMRQLRHAGHSIASTIFESSSPDGFVILTGVGDSTSFVEQPTWQLSASEQDKCYFADSEHPAADIAAQAAAALAVISRAMMDHGRDDDTMRSAIEQFATKAVHAYEYAVQMWQSYPGRETCSVSPANTNCIGKCLPYAESVCQLYRNPKDARQHLFLAAAALYLLTGEQSYRREADFYFDPSASLFLTNWNAVAPLGVAILAGIDDEDEPFDISTAEYQRLLRRSVQQWADCSNKGESGDQCRRSEDGNAYPITAPWGQTGAGLSAVCHAAIYHKLQIDSPVDPRMRAARCFMQRQLGWLTNHRCDRDGEACATGSPEGFSYIVGLGPNSPTRVRHRDAAGIVLARTAPDKNRLCGAVVAGPWAPPGSATDAYLDSRTALQTSSTGLDLSGAALCAFVGWAETEGLRDDECGADLRTPLTARDT